MVLPAPLRRVLFADDDTDALNWLMARVEPLFLACTVRSARNLKRYVSEFNPGVVVLSDGLKQGRHTAREIVADLREAVDLPVLVLTESLSEPERASWIEAGATETILHPTRMERRLRLMTDRILVLGGQR